ncbi:eCIS core domain-containing protein [Hyalangium versicolor]|uniref:eCIS core domain-containing protein n=1 Tax=Hyalangium versicolor TaxID=2861190 RepID=UPI001CCE4143|nr:DUF4157 domain-containing protein [Hyalangium versicolor]
MLGSRKPQKIEAPKREPENAPQATASMPGTSYWNYVLRSAAGAGGEVPPGAQVEREAYFSVRPAPAPAPTLFRSEAPSGLEADPDHPAVHEALQRRGQGEPLPAGVRQEMSERFGVDLGRVRIHSDEGAQRAAQAVHARAFTVGEEIFTSESLSPHERGGRELLAHELTHVVQSYEGRTATGARMSQPGDTLEREAKERAATVAQGHGAHPSLPAAPAPAAAPTSRLLLRDTPPEGSKGKGARRPAPANGTFEFEGDLLVASRAWLFSQYPLLEEQAKKTEIHIPDLLRWILAQYKAHGTLAWADDKVLDEAVKHPKVKLQGPVPDDPGTGLPLFHTVLRHIGAPQDALIKCQRVANYYYIIVDFGTFKGSSYWVGSRIVPDRNLRERIFTALEAEVGMKMQENVRTFELNRKMTEDNEWTIEVLNDVRAATWNFMPEAGAYYFGQQRWASFLKTGTISGKPTQESVGGVPVAPKLSKEDREFLDKFLKELNLPPSPDPDKNREPITSYQISLLRKLDAHPLKQQILERIRNAKGSGKDAPDALSAQMIEDLIAQVDLETARKTLEMPERKPGGEKPLTSSRLKGQIINRSGILTDKKDKAEFFFKVTNTDVVFAVPWVTIEWRAHAAKRDDTNPRQLIPQGQVQSDHAHYIDRESESERFNADQILKKPGLYQIHAFVDHNFFYPAHFEIPVEVLSEREHISQMEAEAGFGDLEWEKKSFGVGLDANTEGYQGAGKLPAEWRRTFAARIKFLEKDRERLKQLVDHYKGSDANADLLQYATEALKRLDESRTLLGTEATKGYHSFEARGVYSTRETGMKEGPLTLLGMARKTQDGKVEVKLHDLSKIWEQVDYHFHATEDTFDKALEAVFYELAKTYPPGRVSAAFEQLDEKGERTTGKRLGFELGTGTAWKSVKGVLYSTPAQIIVNVAGTAVMIFLPVSAPIVLGVLASYNAVSTIDNMAEMEAKGLLTKKEVAKGVAMIGMDLLPYVGRAKVFAKTARATFLVIDGVQMAGMVVIMRDTGLEQLKNLRDGQMKQIAELDEEVRKLEKNPAHPDLRAKRRELELKILETRTAGTKMFLEMAGQGLLMLAPNIVFGKITEKVMGAKLGQLQGMGLFEHTPGLKEPRYDPSTGKFHIDTQHLPELSILQLERIKKTYATDLATRTEQLAKMLGTGPEKVDVVRGAKTQVEATPEGGYKVTVGEGQGFQDALDAAWAHRSAREPGATRPDVSPPIYRPTYSAADIKGKANIIVGNKLEMDQAAAHKVMRQVSGGDPEGFRVLGVEMPEGFDPRTVEWGLGQLPDGSFIVIRGHGGYVDWAPFPGVKPVAHSHPLVPGKYISGEPKDLHIRDIMSGEKGNSTNRVNLAPSAADVAFCARNNIEGHVVHTPYVDKGKGVVGNPTPGGNEPRIDIEIGKPEHVGSFFGNQDIPVYKAEMVARAGGKEIWRGPMWTVDHPAIGSLVEARPLPGTEAGIKGAEPKGGATKSGTEKGARVQTMTEGLYDVVPTSAKNAHTNPDGGRVEFEHLEPYDDKGWQVHTTLVEFKPTGGGDSVHGYVERAFRRKPDGTVEMELREINLAGIPSKLDGVDKPMVGTATPTHVWVQTQQMKRFGAKTGEVSRVTLKTVENVEAICQITVKLHELGLQPTPENVSKVVAQSASYFYAETLLTQSGHQVVGAKAEGGKVMKLSDVVAKHQESTAQAAELAARIPEQYKLDPSTEVLSGFDIVIDSAPRPGGKQ